MDPIDQDREGREQRAQATSQTLRERNAASGSGVDQSSPNHKRSHVDADRVALMRETIAKEGGNTGSLRQRFGEGVEDTPEYQAALSQVRASRMRNYEHREAAMLDAEMGAHEEEAASRAEEAREREQRREDQARVSQEDDRRQQAEQAGQQPAGQQSSDAQQEGEQGSQSQQGAQQSQQSRSSAQRGAQGAKAADQARNVAEVRARARSAQDGLNTMTRPSPSSVHKLAQRR